MPPRKTPTRAAASAADAASFFHRAKKPHIAERIVAAKRSPPSSQELAKSGPNSHLYLTQQQPPRSASKSSENDSDSSPPSDPQEDGCHGLSTQVLCEIASDNSWDSPEGEDRNECDDLSAAVHHTASAAVHHTASAPAPKLFTEILPPAPATPRKRTSPKVAATLSNIEDGIHQGDLSEGEKTLRQFDLSPKYGPSLDVTRLERWQRAFELGLNPPRDVKDLILMHSASNTSLFAGRV
ncbi:DNA polymerase delta, subunit 4-domain-containing protein [Gamsiella multidivaricata]|uniref:DNA polymerase delta, subunit 4-domain-containing protein n=1 Tax=Gamsiella multidivaricata TaxID=101098 RepID=UPI002221066F|nr:DNA polymerase delta, subunit 4-domain-containing protein [Gamsiella multidivaricata]KAG0367369.1 DNA polymerase delta subunit 4 [Gamsiella multidivaricata]KAI7824346.1 DNA polymerase delta, subunit 4-domain-containing protein [Gamsiella multidivaricata]